LEGRDGWGDRDCREVGQPFRITRPGLALALWSGWLTPLEAEALRQHLLGPAIPWEQPEVRVYGRLHPVPRLVCWFGDPGCTYRYSGLVHAPLPWTAPLATLRQRLHHQLGCDFNSLLLNRYRSGADRMGWHADDEAELDPEHPIASLSLGVSRTLRFRPRPERRPMHQPEPRRRPPSAEAIASEGPAGPSALASPFGLELTDGDLLLMEAPTQRHWQHALPARSRVVGERLNLTFRRIRRGSPPLA
jgi:alkylated DNA repair dioxygenase AlkB